MDNVMSFAPARDEPARETDATSSEAAPGPPRVPPLAQALYRLRRRRDGMFASRLFSDPAWDLLLDLVAAEGAGKRVCVTSACIAMAAPTTTALRFLKQMEGEGLVYREADSADKRRIYVRLTGEALSRMEGLFRDLERSVAA